MNDSPKEVLFTESPVSWNTRYISPDGFDCQITLRGESGQEVLEKANTAIAYLLTNGCTPSTRTIHTPTKPTGNGNGNDDNHNGNHEAGWCPIHQCSMKRWEKDGRVWFSHKAGDEWCSGKPKRK